MPRPSARARPLVGEQVSSGVPSVRRSPLLSALATLLLLLLVSRGAFEPVVGKTVAYAVQAAAALGVVALVVVSGRPRGAHGARVGWTAFYVLTLVALASGAATLAMRGSTYFYPYIGVTMLIATLMVAVSTTVRTRPVLDLLPAAGITLVALVGVATVQQLGGLAILPGSDTASLGGQVRPSSLTGSYLHYPLCAAVLTFVFAAVFAASRKRAYGLLALLGGAAVVVSYSRSGMMIIGVGLLLVGVLSPGSGAKLRAAYVLAVAGLVAFLTLGDSAYADRAFSALSIDGAGNEIRVERWQHAFDLWFDSPLLIGSYTGEITNVTANLAGVESTVVESGTLQQLLNFGLLGVVAYYVVMARTVAAVRPAHAWLRAGLVACILQTAVYQSIEVLPFMTLYALAPAMLDRMPLRRVRSDAAGSPLTTRRAAAHSPRLIGGPVA